MLMGARLARGLTVRFKADSGPLRMNSGLKDPWKQGPLKFRRKRDAVSGLDPTNPDTSIDSYTNTGDKEIRYDEDGHAFQADLYLSAVLFGVSQVFLRKALIVYNNTMRLHCGRFNFGHVSLPYCHGGK